MTWLDDLTLSTVVVHTRDGQSIRGLAGAVHDDGLVLRDPIVLEDSGVIELGGTVFIPREQVAFMQLVDA